LRATGCWELPELYSAWETGGIEAVHEAMESTPFIADDSAAAAAAVDGIAAAAASRSTRPVMTRPPVGIAAQTFERYGGGGGAEGGSRAGGMGGGRRDSGNPTGRRVLVHPSGFRQSPYADVKPPGGDTKSAPRKLWHSSPGSAGG
jgi:error-prone DNA polymerase